MSKHLELRQRKRLMFRLLTPVVASLRQRVLFRLAFPKQGRIRLEGDQYRALIASIFERDAWRCRRCGRRQHLEPHHIVPRSILRLDTTANIVTLCHDCHEDVQRHRLDIIEQDANSPLSFINR